MKEREKYIDNAKAFAIILVVVGHIAVILTEKPHDFWGILSYLIYCFHMPFFFLLSGVSFGVARRKRIIANNVEYIAMHCLDFAWEVGVFSILSFLIFSKQMLQNVEMTGVYSVMLKCISNYWFLVVLCFIYMLVPWIKDIKIPVIAVTLFCSFACGIMYMPAAKFLLYLFFFILGVYLSHNHEKILEMRYKSLIIFILSSVIYYFLSGGKLLDDVYSKALLGATGSLFFLSVFLEHSEDMGVAFLKLGQNTLIIYLTHGWVLQFAQEWKIWNQMLGGWAKFLFLAITVSVICGMEIFILEKYTKLKWILLKPSKWIGFFKHS